MPEPLEPPFDVRVREADAGTVLGFEGDLDLLSADRAGEALLEAQAAGATVVLDLRALRFIELHESWVAEPRAVPLARASVSSLAQRAGVTPEALDDIRLAVSEAASNVVLHAYVGSAPGPLELHAKLSDRRLVVEVRDAGGGLRARPDSPGLGLGLSLISSLTESVQISSSGSGPNRVTMTFDLDAMRASVG